jgi:hypothetical protein
MIIETDYIDAREVAWLKSRNIDYNIWKSPVAVWVPRGDGTTHDTYPMVAFEVEFASDRQVEEFRQFRDQNISPRGDSG